VPRHGCVQQSSLLDRIESLEGALAAQNNLLVAAQQDAVWQTVTFSLSMCLIRRAAGGPAEAHARFFETIVEEIATVLDDHRRAAKVIGQGLELLSHLASVEECHVQVSGQQFEPGQAGKRRKSWITYSSQGTSSRVGHGL
jgi:hypothetical protein